MKGYSTRYLNFLDTAPIEDNRRLSVMSVDRQKTIIKRDTSLNDDDLTLIQEFCDREIRGRGPKYVLLIFSKIFRRIKNETLRQKYFLNSAISKSSGTTSFEYLCRLVQVVCKECDDEELKIKFLFDTFADHQSTIKRNAVKDFAEIFKIPLNEFKEGTSITFDEFSETVEEYEIEYS